MVRAVLVGAVEQVGVEEERVARLHLHIDQFLALQQFFHAFKISAGLVDCQNMLDAPGMMLPANHL